jgi:hypothetical protein
MVKGFSADPLVSAIAAHAQWNLSTAPLQKPMYMISQRKHRCGALLTRHVKHTPRAVASTHITVQLYVVIRREQVRGRVPAAKAERIKLCFDGNQASWDYTCVLACKGGTKMECLWLCSISVSTLDHGGAQSRGTLTSVYLASAQAS